MTSKSKSLEGGCTCGHVRYQLTSDPLIVHCCHCRWCQRQTGSAFAINALFVADEVELLKGEVKAEMVDSPSGKGQRIARCPKCDKPFGNNRHLFNTSCHHCGHNLLSSKTATTPMSSWLSMTYKVFH